VGDRVALDPQGEFAVSDFNFLLGMKQKGFADLDGLIGLTRTTDEEYTMLYKDLYDAGKTDSEVFAFYMTDEDQ
jgi:hypothetical protein